MRAVLSGDSLQKKILESVHLLCGTVKDSLGPMGRNVLINVSDREPFITNDGVTIAENITSDDIVVQTILEILKEASLKTNEVVGDGTTTTLVLLEAILKESYEQNVDSLFVKEELEKSLPFVLERIAKLQRKPRKRDYRFIATVAANHSDIGNIASEVFLSIKRRQCIFLEESKTENTYFEKMNGYSLNVKISEEYFFDQNSFELDCCHVVYLDYKIERLEDISYYINQSVEYHDNYILLCEGYSRDVLEGLVDLFESQQCFIVIAEWLMYHNLQDEIMEDIHSLEEHDMISKVNITPSTILLYSSKNPKKRRDILLKRYEEVEEEYQKELLLHRIAMLDHGFATIYVGGVTTTEKREKLMRFEDALWALERAQSGIVPGGGICFYQISESLKEDGIGNKILKKALCTPLYQILENANISKEDIVYKLAEERYEVLYNLKTRSFESIYETGIIEPLEVVTYALKNAVSIACMILSINHLVINDFQEKSKDYEM